MGHVVVELKMVVDDRMVGMIELQQVFEGASALLMQCLDIVDVD